MLSTGIKGTLEMTVTENDTAEAIGSGGLPVFATPSMIMLMEKTSAAVVRPYLAEGDTTVGTLVNIRHLSATPVTGTIRCESELTEVDRKRLTFRVTAFDDAGLIGEGSHERFIVTAEKFMAKTNAKLSK